MNLSTADFYFKGALAAIRLSCNIIFSGGHLQWSNIFTSTVFFKQALAVIHWVNSIKSSCSHPFDELPFSYYKRVIATTHSFTFTVFLQNWNFSKGILTIILIPPWFQACIYWKKFVIWRHHLQPSIFSMIVSLLHGSNPHVKETVFISQSSIIIVGLRLIREKVEEYIYFGKTVLDLLF